MRNILFIILLLFPVVCNSQINTGVTLVIGSGIKEGKVKRSIETNSSNLLTKLNEAFKKEDQVLDFKGLNISANGAASLNELWKFGHFYCTKTKITEKILNRRDSSTYQIRNIPVVFGNADTVDIVMDYNRSDGQIDSLYLGLTAHQYIGVMGNNVQDATRRTVILNFIENLRNYYIRKDTTNIRKLYSDKALIIVGKVLETTNEPVDRLTTFTSGQVTYLVQSKNQYIKRLQEVFNKSNNLILNFKNIEVIKHTKNDNFYGVLLQQSWKSSTYSDEGWLFLVLQFREDGKHLIWVRTWQDVRDTSPDSVFGLHNFRIPSGV